MACRPNHISASSSRFMRLSKDAAEVNSLAGRDTATWALGSVCRLNSDSLVGLDRFQRLRNRVHQCQWVFDLIGSGTDQND